MWGTWDRMGQTYFLAKSNIGDHYLVFHATEMHVQSNDWKTIFLLSFIPNTIQQNHRLGCGVNNLFNRGYKMATQLQVEAGHN